MDRERCGGGREASGKEEPREDAHPAKAGEEELGTPARGCVFSHTFSYEIQTQLYKGYAVIIILLMRKQVHIGLMNCQ